MKSFMQTQKWGTFQKSLGAECFWIEGVLVVKYKLPFGKHYLYIPRSEIGAAGLERIVSCCQNNAIFLRIEPEIESRNIQFVNNIIKLGFKKARHGSQPSKTLILDITKPESEILSNMRPKTRYNIRLAEQKGVEIDIKDNLSQEEFERFCELIEKTSARNKFSSFSREYYEKLLKIIITQKNVGDPIPYIKIFLAEYAGKMVAASLVMFYGDTATYLHGASDYNFRQLMAPHLSQWQAILEAKRRGMQFYDFWGVDEQKWPGVTRFKKGFGGQEVEYVGTWDYVFWPAWYWAYRLGKKLKPVRKFAFLTG